MTTDTQKIRKIIAKERWERTAEEQGRLDKETGPFIEEHDIETMVFIGLVGSAMSICAIIKCLLMDY